MNKLTGNYYCEICNYTTDKKYNYDRHILTKSHKNTYNKINNIQTKSTRAVNKKLEDREFWKDSSKTALNLSESTKNLSESTKNFSESNKDLVKTSKELLQSIHNLLNEKFKNVPSLKLPNNL